MREVARQPDAPSPQPGEKPTAGLRRDPRPIQAQALALQRAVGNRAAARVLARWTAHPDKAQKGAFVSDAVAEEYLRFNPPKSQ